MFEETVSNEIYPDSTSYENQTPFSQFTEGFSKIVAIGYGENQSQCLPTSRYSNKISVLGLGLRGAVSAIGLAALGNKVIGVDHDQRKINAINQGRVSSKDVRLPPLLKQVRRINNLVATDDLHNAILGTDQTIICVGHNCLQKETAEQSIKLTRACEQIGTTLKHKNDFHVLIICQPFQANSSNSIIIPRIEHASSKKVGQDFGVCILDIPLSEHQALTDFYFSPHATIASSDKKTANIIDRLFNGFDTKFRHQKLA